MALRLFADASPVTAGLALTSLDDPRWLDFVASRPEATLFHHPAWSRVLVDSYGYAPAILLQLSQEGDVLAGLPLLDVHGFSRRRRFSSLPFTDYCPPLASSERVLTELTSALVRWQGASAVDELVVHGGLASNPQIQPVLRGVRHVLPLAGSGAEFLERIKGSQVHRAIKKAVRQGVIARISHAEADIDLFYELHLLTRRRQGVPVQPKRFFRLIWKHIIDRRLGFAVLAHMERQPIAGAIYLGWNGNMIYKFGASDPRFWELRPNNLVMWTAIEWACERGFRQLDFGRSELENAGLREFKRRWGALELPLHYSYLGAAVRAGSKPRLSLQVMRRVIQRSPALVCRLTGELLYGRLPGFAA